MPKRKQPDEFHFWFFNKNIAADALHPCSAMSVSHFRRRSSQIPYRMARYERRPRRRRSPGLPRGGCLRPEMRLGHHLLRACRGWQAARKPPHRSQRPHPGRNHSQRDQNEIFESWNQGAKYHLAIVLVGADDSIDGPHYVPHPFKEEPGWGVSSVNYDLKALLARAQGI